MPLLRRTPITTIRSLRGRRTLENLSGTSFAEPKLSELVPTLIGESSFASWSTALKCALDTRDPHLFEILTGHSSTRSRGLRSHRIASSVPSPSFIPSRHSSRFS
ncbi:hypothetical protein VN97_g9869 [Penicillium thymicola]|uniref:Uncharacterized protein n=1 Tax=Penicillium thymicola TaxID=293382 RepID=A0AAI9TA48_PENTH|nr:hypothetical protein VN97_g9869 [Penicillium thymicola]